MTKLNPLLSGIRTIEAKVQEFKGRAKGFYFQVLLGQHSCPVCGEGLCMTGPSECRCQSGHRLDPTIEFQKSLCCGAGLRKRLLHYVCAACGSSQASHFLFDERLFDPEYFRTKMAEHRARARARKEAARQALAESRSGAFNLMEEPNLESLPGLLHDLDSFIGLSEGTATISALEEDPFDLESYQAHIASSLGWSPVRFSEIPYLTDNQRLDKVRRFMTLLFMEQDREVCLSQSGPEIWVQRRQNEADQ